MTESHIQQQIVQTLSLYAERYNFVYFAPMNENLISTLIMAKIPKDRRMRIYNHALKMGFQPGVSDILIFHDGKVFCMELKTSTGAQSKNQKIFMNNVLKADVDYAVVRSVDDALDVLRVWGVIE